MPDVIGAVKRALDDDPRPGRLIVTGSVRGDLDGELWPGTGRLTRIPLFGMAVREQLGLTTSEPFLDRAVSESDLRAALTVRTFAATWSCGRLVGLGLTFDRLRDGSSE